MCMRADVQHTRMDAHACSRSRAKTGLRALFDDGVAGVCHGRVERRLSIIVDGARVGARSQEQLNDLGVPRLRCCVEQTVLLRGVGLPREQDRDCARVPDSHRLGDVT